MKNKKINWQEALEKFLDILTEPLEKEPFKWVIMGSVASVLQGCKLQPNDIDILVKESESVHFISSFLNDYFGEYASTTPFEKKKIWVSSKKQPVFEGIGPYSWQWTYSKFLINELYIEITHKIPPNYSLEKSYAINESGPSVWNYIKTITFNGMNLPVVPLEIQLATNFERGFNERINQIIKIFKKETFDQKLVNDALNEKFRQKFEKLMT